MAGEDTSSDDFRRFSGEWYQRLVEGVAGVYNGGKPANAVELSPDDEVEKWRQPTSPAALRALELGGTLEDAQAANALWAHALRGEQIKIQQAMAAEGAPPQAIHDALTQQGLTDDQIFATCRKYAAELANTNGHNTPKGRVAYHKKMAEKAAARRAAGQPSIVTLTGEETQHATPGPDPEQAGRIA